MDEEKYDAGAAEEGGSIGFDPREHFPMNAYIDLVDFVTDFQHTRSGKPSKRMCYVVLFWFFCVSNKGVRVFGWTFATPTGAESEEFERIFLRRKNNVDVTQSTRVKKIPSFARRGHMYLINNDGEQVLLAGGFLRVFDGKPNKQQAKKS